MTRLLIRRTVSLPVDLTNIGIKTSRMGSYYLPGRLVDPIKRV